MIQMDFVSSTLWYAKSANSDDIRSHVYSTDWANLFQNLEKSMKWPFTYFGEQKLRIAIS